MIPGPPRGQAAPTDRNLRHAPKEIGKLRLVGQTLQVDALRREHEVVPKDFAILSAIDAARVVRSSANVLGVVDGTIWNLADLDLCNVGP